MISELCYRDGCDNEITGASDYCSEACERRALADRIRADLAIRPGGGWHALTEDEARTAVEKYDRPDPPKPGYGLFQTLPAPIQQRGFPVYAPLPVDLPTDPAERLMAIFMLCAARFAPRGGQIRFSAIDRDETGDHVVRQASIPTEDARRLTGLPHRETEEPGDDDG